MYLVFFYIYKVFFREVSPLFVEIYIISAENMLDFFKDFFYVLDVCFLPL